MLTVEGFGITFAEHQFRSSVKFWKIGSKNRKINIEKVVFKIGQIDQKDFKVFK